MTGIMYRDASSSSVPQQKPLHHDTSSNPHHGPHRPSWPSLMPHRILIDGLIPVNMALSVSSKPIFMMPDPIMPDPICSVFSQPALRINKATLLTSMNIFQDTKALLP